MWDEEGSVEKQWAVVGRRQSIKIDHGINFCSTEWKFERIKEQFIGRSSHEAENFVDWKIKFSISWIYPQQQWRDFIFADWVTVWWTQLQFKINAVEDDWNYGKKSRFVKI